MNPPPGLDEFFGFFGKTDFFGSDEEKPETQNETHD
jgi:hypothetical protein